MYGENVFIDIEYEKLVSDTASTTKNLWDYCNLEGEFSYEKRKTTMQILLVNNKFQKISTKHLLKNRNFRILKISFLMIWTNKINFG